MLEKSKSGNSSIFNNSNNKENNNQLPLSKFILNKYLQMNLTTNKNNKINSLISHFSDSEKRNENNSQDNNSIQIKRTSSVSRNNKNNKNNRNNYYNSIYKINKANTIIQYNINYNKRKKNVSLNSSIKTINNHKNHLEKHRIINDLSDRDYSTMSKENNCNKKKKDWIAYIQSKTQRARDYSMIVKKNNINSCSINHNSDRRISSSSKSKSRNKNKIKGSSNSKILIGKSSLIDISVWINKINFKNRKKIRKEVKKVNINNIISKEKNNDNNNKTKKSRNLKHENISFKSSSIDNNKKNPSSSLKMNVITIYNPRNINYKPKKMNHKSNKKEYYKSNNCIINNINETINTNYARLYIKKNHLKRSFEGNFTINTHTIQPQKPLISSRINKK